MNHNINLQCEICKNIVRLKIYGGYVTKNSYVYNCPECNVTISGHLIWNEDPEEGFIKEFKSNNATKYPGKDSESHVLQIATEFFTDKIKMFNISDPTMFLSPFMIEKVDFETKQKRATLLNYITDNFQEDLIVTLRLWELYKNKKNKYLKRQLLLYNFVEPVPLGQVLKVDYPTKIIEAIYKSFSAFITESGYINDINMLRKMLNDIDRKNPNDISELYKDLKDLIEYYDENIIHLLKNFANYYSYIWPIILSRTYEIEDIDELKEKKGILTTNFESLKNYYVEAFEILCSLLPIFLGVQNIKLRGNRNAFEKDISNKFPKIKSIVEYDKKVMNKGNKVKFFENENVFSN